MSAMTAGYAEDKLRQAERLEHRRIGTRAYIRQRIQEIESELAQRNPEDSNGLQGELRGLKAVLERI